MRVGERTVERVVVKRNNPTFLDVYGHWWVEIDEVESYGWWPAVRPVPVASAIRGVPGVLNGLGARDEGSPTVDPRHGELADHAFHPVVVGDRSDSHIVAAIRRYATTFDGGWRWSIRPTVNCRSFQAGLLAAAGLVVPCGYAHSAGAGCPFLASPRRWRAQVLAVWGRRRHRAARNREVAPPAPDRPEPADHNPSRDLLPPGPARRAPASRQGARPGRLHAILREECHCSAQKIH